jgi:uncharacterized protein (TIGR03084 family)
MQIFDDLEAEEERLEDILAGLDEATWLRASAAPGWSVTDVVLHLAQSEELVVESGWSTASGLRPGHAGLRNLDAQVDALVRAQAAPPAAVFERWRAARRQALAVLRDTDPDRRMPWVTDPIRPATLATTRLAEHWAHGLDVCDPLGIDLADTDRLRHIAWLGHRSIPYAFSLAHEDPPAVRCELAAPGGDTWDLGPAGAPVSITGSAGDFCRVGARRMAPEASRLVATGSSGARVLQLLRNYAA